MFTKAFLISTWLSLALAGYTFDGGYLASSTGNSTSGLAKRWQNVDFSSTNAKTAYWPEKTLTYCYADDASETAISPFMNAAWGLWLTAGADHNLKLVKGSSSQCGDANRALFMLVTANTVGAMRTTPGMKSADGDIDGPTMHFDPSSSIGTGSTVTNLAHELGHAWGFGHEHQRRDAWSTTYGGKKVANLLQFNCQNLKDYASITADMSDYDKQRICTSQVAAQQAGFSGLDMLPFPYNWVEGGDFDWDSIMLYGSTAGAIAGTSVLLKADGSAIVSNMTPSRGDVTRLNAMYSSTAAQASICPAWKDCSTKKSLFKKIFTSKKKSC